MTAKKTYHHENLRAVLLEQATLMIRESGVEALSMRKLAERAGVSRTAAYHYFSDKNELLCTIAESGYQRSLQLEKRMMEMEDLDAREQIRWLVTDYVRYAWENPEQYDLMYGRIIWKGAGPTPSLRNAAMTAFKKFVEVVTAWQEQGALSKDQSPLRLAQAFWGSMHGITRLLVDGIYLESSSLEEICTCLCQQFIVEPEA